MALKFNDTSRIDISMVNSVPSGARPEDYEFFIFKKDDPVNANGFKAGLPFASTTVPAHVKKITQIQISAWDAPAVKIIDTNTLVSAGLNGAQPVRAINSILLGIGAGGGASVYEDIFIGQRAGLNTTGATSSVFIGDDAGAGAGSAIEATLIGLGAGMQSQTVQSSTLIGISTGRQAEGIMRSMLLANSAGRNAVNIDDSIFIGVNAGAGAKNITHGIFIGESAGGYTDGASYCTLIGTKAGVSFAGNNIGANNIVMGTNISLPNGAENSANIGGVLFATGLHFITEGIPSVAPSPTGRIGIGVVNPQEALHIAGNIRIANGQQAEGKVLVSDTNGTAFWKNNNSIGAVTIVGDQNLVSTGFAPVFPVLDNIYQSVILGSGAANNSPKAISTVAIGYNALSEASATSSVVIGFQAGYNTPTHIGSIILGEFAGANRNRTKYSVIIGMAAGTSVNKTDPLDDIIAIGHNAARKLLPSDGVLGANNIIIGNDITLDDGASNSINLGGIIFGTGMKSFTGLPSSSPAPAGKIGIGVAAPKETLEVNGSVLSKVKVQTANPTALQIPDGYTMVVRNSATNQTHLWANINGTLIKTLLT